jgi:transposase
VGSPSELEETTAMASAHMPDEFFETVAHHLEPHIAKRKTSHGSGLGKVRWVVERTISWLKGLRRMRVRYDRLGVIIDAWTTLAAGVICFRILHHDSV